MINFDELKELSTIISEKRFLAEVFLHYRAPYTGYVGNKFFSSNIELNITGITYWYDVSEELREDGIIQSVGCKIVDKLLENRIAKRIVPKKDRTHKYYDSIFLSIKGSEIKDKFKLISLPDFSKIDLNNEYHRKYIVDQYLFKNNVLYNFNKELQQKLDDIKGEYTLGFITKNEAYNQMLYEFKISLQDYSIDENMKRIIDWNKN